MNIYKYAFQRGTGSPKKISWRGFVEANSPNLAMQKAKKLKPNNCKVTVICFVRKAAIAGEKGAS